MLLAEKQQLVLGAIQRSLSHGIRRNCTHLSAYHATKVAVDLLDDEVTVESQYSCRPSDRTDAINVADHLQAFGHSKSSGT
jgi:hypothetical protein